MTRGKSICSVLKTIRKQVAEANEIKYEPRECHHKGECRGTCPACEAEVRYIERQLDIRRQLGKAAVIVGLSAGLSALTSCCHTLKKVSRQSEEESRLTMGKALVEPMPEPEEALVTAGEVVVEPEPIEVLGRTGDMVVEPEPPALGEVSDRVYDVVDEMPSFPGGPSALMAFIDSVKRYPADADELCAQGRVILTFVVEKDGSLTNVKVVKSVEPSLDKEAVRVVKRMPKWNPGKDSYGRPYRVKYTIPVSFKLN